MWKDPKWSKSMKNALTNLWGKHADTGRYVREAGQAKEKYATLVADVLGWITDHEEIEITRDLLKTKETGMVGDALETRFVGNDSMKRNRYDELSNEAERVLYAWRCHFMATLGLIFI